MRPEYQDQEALNAQTIANMETETHPNSVVISTKQQGREGVYQTRSARQPLVFFMVCRKITLRSQASYSNYTHRVRVYVSVFVACASG
jgi:hypothetical protein